jgi:membrane protein implicated in regulation of membrane protease activity
MATTQTSEAGFSPDGRSLMIGAVLMGVGSAIALAGFAIYGATMVSATRRWIEKMETPPSQIARQRLNQARSAAMARAGAWRNGSASKVAADS